MAVNRGIAGTWLWWGAMAGLWLTLPVWPRSQCVAPPQLIVSGEPTAGFGAVLALRAGCEGPAAPHCSGVAVAPNWVLTAAHCVDRYNWSHDLMVLADTVRAGVVAIPVVAVHRHPRYDRSRDWDVALLRLAGPVPSPPLPLDSAAPSELVGTDVLAIGYGDTRSASERGWRKRLGRLHVEAADEQLLTMLPAPSMTCQGDSGGPILREVDADDGGDAQGPPVVIVGITVEGDPGCYEEGIAVTSAALTAWVDEVRLQNAPGVALSSVCPIPSSAEPRWGGCQLSRPDPHGGGTPLHGLCSFAVLVSLRARRRRPPLQAPRTFMRFSRPLR